MMVLTFVLSQCFIVKLLTKPILLRSPLIVGNYMKVMWQALYQRKERKNTSIVKRKNVFFHRAKLLEIFSQLGLVYEVRVIDS